jgi:hypothetical protein
VQVRLRVQLWNHSGSEWPRPLTASVAMRSPLCVLAPRSGVLSETFVAWDVDELLPGRTVVVVDPPPNGETATDGSSWTTNASTTSVRPGRWQPSASRKATSRSCWLSGGAQRRGCLVEFIDFAERWFETLRGSDVRTWGRARGGCICPAQQQLPRRFREQKCLSFPTAPTIGPRES